VLRFGQKLKHEQFKQIMLGPEAAHYSLDLARLRAMS
jgi:hypothetical protein